MKIRAGYDITFNCIQQVPMLLMLSVHPSRRSDLLCDDKIEFSPKVQARDFKDAFGNICTRLVAPTGRLEIHNEFIIADSGQPDIVATDAEQWPIDALPDDALTYLLGSRYCDTQKLSNHAWSLFGHIQGGWARYANTFTTVFSSDISMPGMTGPRRKDIKSVSAYVGTSPILL